MRKKRIHLGFLLGAILGSFIFLGKGEALTPLEGYLPQIEGWVIKGEVLKFSPENLFEYIDGAAEAYLSYNFQTLVAAEYQKKDSQQTVSVEIYDMGSVKNAFGIYSAERYPESKFIPLGLQGYEEEGVLNFLVSHFYVKLLSFETENSGENILRVMAEDIVERIGEKGDWPLPLKVLPVQGKVSNSEKFILKNFLGYHFLHDGYLAHYRWNSIEFDCFIIDATDGPEAQRMVDQYLQLKKEGGPKKIASGKGYQLRDRYYQNVFLARQGKFVVGVMKIPDDQQELGLIYLQALLKNCPGSYQ